jgi:hypothetical protein
MTQGNGATSSIELFPRDLKLIDGVSGLTSESLVDFPDINVFDAESCLLEGLWDSESWTNAHDFWWDTCAGKAEHSSSDWEAEFDSNGSSSE